MEAEGKAKCSQVDLRQPPSAWPLRPISLQSQPQTLVEERASAFSFLDPCRRQLLRVDETDKQAKLRQDPEGDLKLIDCNVLRFQ